MLAPYGVHGWIKVQPYTLEPAGLLDYPVWSLAAKMGQSAWRPFPLLGGRSHAATIVAQLAGIASREDAMAWRGALVGVARAELPATKPGEHYWSDLVGLAVVNRSGDNLGSVTGVLDTGAHPVLRVTGGPAESLGTTEGRERLIPMVPAYVDAIDIEAARITVDWALDY